MFKSLIVWALMALSIIPGASGLKKVAQNYQSPTSIETGFNNTIVSPGVTMNVAITSSTALNVIVTTSSLGILNVAVASPVSINTSTLGIVNVALASTIAGEDITNDVMKVEQRFSYYNVAATTTATIKTGTGFLHSICNNKTVTSSVYTVYDNTAGSGTKIATITQPATVLENQFCQIYDVTFNTGLTLTFTGATVPDLTISYR